MRAHQNNGLYKNGRHYEVFHREVSGFVTSGWRIVECALTFWQLAPMD
jgi:hypothetical protein